MSTPMAASDLPAPPATEMAVSTTAARAGAIIARTDRSGSGPRTMPTQPPRHPSMPSTAIGPAEGGKGTVMTASNTNRGAKGAVEGIKGKIKEAAGALRGDRELKREGRAQQDKADAEREAARKETEAARARAEAQVHEAREAAHQER